jgi:rubrerythrin
MENQLPILDGIDPEITERLVSRRDAIRQGASMSSRLAAGLALGSVPVALAALAKETFAQTPADILDVLRFAFILENLENEFYKAVLGTSAVAAQNNAFATVRALIPDAARQAFQQIQKHEQQHVDFLKATIPQFGGTPVTITANDFDFTGGNGTGTGPFVRATTELDFLLLSAQAFEDTGVRAYKGQAPRLLINGNNTADIVLESAVRIHSVEARHASKIRRIRRQRNPNDTTLRFSGYVRGGGRAAAGASNITNPPAEVLAALDLVYGGSIPESNTQHVVFNGTAAVTIDAATLTGLDVIEAGERTAAAAQAFDEPLTKDEVIAIVRNFIKDDPARGLP